MENKKSMYSIVALSSLFLSSPVLAFADEPVIVSPIDVVVIEPAVESSVVELPVETVNSVAEEKPVVETPSEPVVENPIDVVVIEPAVESSVVEAPVETVNPVAEEKLVVETPSESVVDTPVIVNDDEDEKGSSLFDEKNGEKEVNITVNENKDSDKKNELEEEKLSVHLVEEVVIPTIEKPIITETGVSIVSTQDSQLVIQEASGELVVVAPETVGAKTENDGTISVVDNEGQKKVLPSTGEESGLLLSGLGFLAVVFGVVSSFSDKFRILMSFDSKGK